jgi:hypothetical protein
MSKIYVASSWRNNYQPEVVKLLRQNDHDVYDFKDQDEFRWTEVDPKYMDWIKDTQRYLTGLNHPRAVQRFNRDMTALINCDICVYVMPCGVSASLEAGWAAGAGKKLIVYIPKPHEPDLMMKMADVVTIDIEEVLRACND